MNKFILSVEDDDAAQRLIEIAFQELGPDFHLYRVTDGIEALKFLTQAEPFIDAPKPDLILSNVHMPRMNGMELLEELKLHDSFREIPVIVLSSSRLTSDRVQCLALGAKHFLTKSSDFENVIAAVKAVCISGVDGSVGAESVHPTE